MTLIEELLQLHDEVRSADWLDNEEISELAHGTPRFDVPEDMTEDFIPAEPWLALAE